MRNALSRCWMLGKCHPEAHSAQGSALFGGAMRVVTLLALFPIVAAAQGPQLAPPLFSSLRWRSIGPTSISGRVNDIAVARRAGRPDELYVGFGGGAVE